MYELLRAIRQRECPKCGATDSMDIQLNYFCIICKSCHAYYLDPFQKGPWTGSSVLDTVDGDMVSSYVVAKEPEIPSLGLNEERAEFFRYLHRDAAKRQLIVAADTSSDEEESSPQLE